MKLRNPLAFNEPRHRARFEAMAFEQMQRIDLCGQADCEHCAVVKALSEHALRDAVEASVVVARARHRERVRVAVLWTAVGANVAALLLPIVLRFCGIGGAQ